MIEKFMPFIDKERRLVIQLFEFIESHREPSHTLNEIADFLDISVYKANIVSKNAVLIAQQFPEVTLIFENDCLFTNNINNAVITKIINKQAYNSLPFQIFLHTFLNMYNQSDAEFQQSVGISTATYFRLKKNLNNAIGLEKIRLLKKSEIFMRYYIHTVLVYFSYFDYSPDSLTQHADFIKMKQTANYAMLVWHINPSRSQQKNFQYFGLVNLLRAKNNAPLLKSDLSYLVTLTSQNELLLFMNHLHKKWHLLKEDAEIATRYYITFLITTYSLPNKHLDFIQENTINQAVTQRQMQHVAFLLDKQGKNIDLSDLQNKLAIVNARVLSPFFKTDLFHYSTKQEHNIVPMNPQADSLIHEFTDMVTHTTTSPFNAIEISEINKIYSLVVLPKLLMRHTDLQVHIVIDFTSGRILNDYISDIFNTLGDLHITIDKNVTNNTEIYLTDTLNPELSIHQIVWKSKPSENQWRAFYNLIFSIRQNKIMNSSEHTSPFK
ncbi:hypothetical protein [Weissella sagaensis]|uniref:hypothetical protein n=1 Tax=Weissella sagaensis TaxID=2559928 RepID=UPI00123B7EEC|nr:hypothetical protein [Weissella sagaensis]KAA8433939.1 hypothetical protein FKV79_03315 [Weissella paramesenteroides]KAA8438291.1 hypothetical protein FKV73_04035 [Weissella paramesenteroides]MBU7568151.1 hypothetical protein [Weissella hellenica]